MWPNTRGPGRGSGGAWRCGCRLKRRRFGAFGEMPWRREREQKKGGFLAFALSLFVFVCLCDSVCVFRLGLGFKERGQKERKKGDGSVSLSLRFLEGGF